MEPIHQASTPMVGGNVLPKMGILMWNWNQLNQQRPQCIILGLDLCQDQESPNQQWSTA